MHEFDSAAWAELHHHWADVVADGVQSLLAGFARLQAIRFAAPWRSETRDAPAACPR